MGQSQKFLVRLSRGGQDDPISIASGAFRLFVRTPKKGWSDLLSRR